MIAFRTILPLSLALAACSPSVITDSKRTMGSAAKEMAETTAKTTISGKLVITQDDGVTTLPAIAAAVYLEGSGAESIPTTTTGTFSVEVPDAAADGTALVDDALGWYALHDSGGVKFGVEQPNVVVRRGEANDLGDVVLTKTAKIVGKVELEGATSQAGATVAIPRTIFSATTDAEGNFTIDAVPASVWQLEVTMPGFAPQTVDSVTTESEATEDVGTMTMTKVL